MKINFIGATIESTQFAGGQNPSEKPVNRSTSIRNLVKKEGIHCQKILCWTTDVHIRERKIL